MGMQQRHVLKPSHELNQQVQVVDLQASMDSRIKPMKPCDM